MNFINYYCYHLCVLFIVWEEISAIIHSSRGRRHPDEFLLQKISMTQKGYIQFLRYVQDVPSITDYTFCIWINSLNFTHNHPILSYSKHEEERLIRVWISPFGTYINMEIMDQPVFKVLVNLKENQWYHICQSWSSRTAVWSLYLNGKLKGHGYAPKLENRIIKEGGDIVVGQEYTDFDKGLDDGIEGHVFGFNFVLSSVLPPKQYAIKHRPLRRHYSTPLNIYAPSQRLIPIQAAEEAAVPNVLGYFNAPPSDRHSKDLFQTMGRNMWGWIDGFGEPNTVRYVQRQPSPTGASSRISNEIQPEYGSGKSMGLLLVELGGDCRSGKGAPLFGKEVLISWTRTPVRVFGGAILKRIPPFC